MTENELRRWLATQVGQTVGLPTGQIAHDRPLEEYGVSSRAAVTLSGELSRLLGRPLPTTLVWQNPTIAGLAAALTATPGEAAGRSARPDGAPVPAAEDGPVAIIGLGCRLPGSGDGPDRFWELLAAGGSGVGLLPDDRWAQFTGDSARDAEVLAALPRTGGYLGDLAGFDAEYFGITPVEAESMDPQQRILLEVAVSALRHAGLPAESLRGTDTGVFVGVSATEYGRLTFARLHGLQAWTATGAAASIVANRLSYLLDLRGPSMTLDTACSSSLVAVHQAVCSLRSGESSVALAGGVNVLLSPGVTATFADGGALAADGRCKVFDAAADGIVRGEGCGVVVLKRLADARRDGDRVLAVIRGSAVNSDGRSNGLTAPNPVAQRAVLARACAVAGVEPSGVDYVEAHGTGTVLGDPIEAGALAEVFGPGRAADRPLLIGSVKSNIGHLEAAAGVAGLIKVVLSMVADRLPASLYYQEPNPHIPFDEYRLRVVAASAGWPRYAGAARAGVSAFGFGGTNAHVILEEWPAARRPPRTRGVHSGPVVLALGAPSPARLAQDAAALADRLDAGAAGPVLPLGAVAYTLARRRDPGRVRAAVVAADAAEAVAGLRAVAADGGGASGDGKSGGQVSGGQVSGGQVSGGQVSGGIVTGRADRLGPGVVFVFSGYGSQWPGMARRLLATEPAFASAVDELDPLFVEQAGSTLRALLGADPDGGGEGDGGDPGIVRVQLVLFGIQVALAGLWRAHGVGPAAVVGNSMGEVAAAVVSGALSPADGLRVILVRSRLLARAEADLVRRGEAGGMAAVALSADAVRDLAGTGYPGITVAVHNSPAFSTVAGPADELARLVERLTAEGTLARLLPVRGGGHSAAVDPILAPLRAALRGLHPSPPVERPPGVRWYGSTRPDPSDPPAADADYWADNTRNPVRFTQAVAAAAADGHRVFVEISPHPLTLVPVTDTVQAATGSIPVVLPTLRRTADEQRTFLTALAALHTLGHPAALAARHPSGQFVELPQPRWQHRQYWVAPPRPAAAVAGHPLLGSHVEVPDTAAPGPAAPGLAAQGPAAQGPAAQGPAAAPPPAVHLWHADLGTAAVPWLADHQTHRVAVLPAAVCAELALAAGAAGLGAGPRAPVVRHLQLPALLPLSAATEVTTRLTVTGPGEGTVELLARDDLGRWTRYGTARVATTPDPATPDPATPGHAAPVVPDTSDWAEVDLPRVLERDGRRCGAGLRALTGARAAGDTVLAGVALPAEAEPATLFRLHPALAEAALQSVIIAAGPGRDDRPADRRAWLVVAVGSIRVPGDPARARHCLARLSGPDTGSAWLLDGDGAVLAELADVRLRRVPAWAVPVPLADKVFERCWVPVPARERSAAQPEPGTWVLLGGSTPDDAECALAEQLRGRGATVLRADRDDPDAVAGMLGAGAHGVVLLTEPEPAGEPTGADLRRAQAAVAAVLSAVRAVTTGVTGEVGHPRLWVLTGAAAGVTAGERPSPLWYALRAMIRVLAFEDPELRATLVDLDSPLDSVGDAPVAAAVAAELGADTVPGEPVEDELALRGGQRWAGRMVPASVPRPGAGVPLARDGGYVITGGLGGLGLLLAGRLAEAGATRVVLSGRGAPGPDARRALARMRASGTELVVINGDIGEPDTASALVAAATRGGLPLRGVAHAAAVLRDAVATGVTAADLRQVWWPKADGGLHLHRATLGHPLDWWLTFSSAAGFVGSPGQSAYATANAWLDGLAAWRRHAGLPATTVNWGAWAETGGADGTANPVLEPVGAAEGMLALQAVLESGRAATTVMRLDAARTLELFPALARRPFFAALADGVRAAAPDTWPGASGLRAAAPARARALLIGRLTERVASIMGFEPGQLDPAAPLMRLGFDSLMALRMRNAVEQDFGLAFPVPIVLRGASLLEVAAHVAGELGLPQPDQPDVPDVPDQAGESDQADARTSEVDSSGIESSTRDGAGRRPWVPEPDIPIRRILRTGRPGSTPLMLFHASGGTTGVYESLVARLPVDQPVYGLERIEGEPDLVARCRRYLEQITEVAPNGPYLLAGWSLGGVLALETAQQLLAAGAEVDLLMLIDTIVPLAGPDLSHTEVILGRLSRFAEHVRGSYGVDLDLPMRTIAEADEDEQIDIVMERLWTRLPVLGEAALVHQYTSYVDARVGERYRPGPYHGRAVLLRADDPHPLTTALDPRYLRDDLTLGWDAFLSELEVFRVPGDHLSMIDPPHVDVVARRLTEQLAVRAARVGGRR